MSKIKVILLMAMEGFLMVFVCALFDIDIRDLGPVFILFMLWGITWSLHKGKN